MPLTVVRTARRLRAAVTAFSRNGERIGFVPTMGALHEGHLSLVRAARRACDRVVVSVFVNPTQFGPREDYHAYPRRQARDRRLLREARADLLFLPTTRTLYPEGFGTWVTHPELSQVLCGARRPHHFRGVLTVVLKLLHLVTPDVLYLGQKDYQQQHLIRQMIRDLDLEVRVRTCPTVRERDGLAMSSRNAYLSPRERQAARILSRLLRTAATRVRAGARRVAPLRTELLHLLRQEKLARLDYLTFCRPDTLAPVWQITQPTLLALAVFIGKTRLIDNRLLRP